ncbi:hypothetical protein HanPSC8_Chr15g0688751 [Helianthus annuus]|nr:hypothetical protein HanPSC8_Chr15g0688751 [Helianthus annuus]
MKMTFRGKEDVATKTTQTPFSEAWYQDLKDVPSIELPKKALVGAGMSLFWWMDREDKPVYMEDGKRWSDGYYPKKADEELWYLRIVKNFALPRDEDLAAQPPTGAGELTNLGTGPEKNKRAPAANIALRKTYTANAQSSMAKNVKGEKKGTRRKVRAIPLTPGVTM